MKVLVSNLGSTSFKYKVFSMPDEQVLAQGGMDRIGGEGSMHKFQIGEGEAVEQAAALPDHECRGISGMVAGEPFVLDQNSRECCRTHGYVLTY